MSNSVTVKVQYTDGQIDRIFVESGQRVEYTKRKVYGLNETYTLSLHFMLDKCL